MTPYLYTAGNRHAPRRANGKRGWYHPHRQGGTAAIRLIVIHTAETNPSPASAENVARWQRDSATVPSSYHRLVDSDSTVVTLPDEAVAFHVVGFNTPSLGLSFATRAGWWGRYPAWDDAALARGANEAAGWADRYGIRRRWLTLAQAQAGEDGFVFHSTLDPSRRSDPGPLFPASRFLDLTRPAPDDLEDLMSAEALDAIAINTRRAADDTRKLLNCRLADLQDQVADLRRQAGRDPSPEDDRRWAVRIAEGNEVYGEKATLQLVAGRLGVDGQGTA